MIMSRNADKQTVPVGMIPYSHGNVRLHQFV